jgi:hypothetical protein
LATFNLLPPALEPTVNVTIHYPDGGTEVHHATRNRQRATRNTQQTTDNVQQMTRV